MKRAWLSLAASGVLLTVINACHNTYNNYTTACCGPACGNSAALAVDPVQDVYKASPGQTPNPFFVAVSSDGRCQDLTGQNGQWIGRVLFASPRSGTFCAYGWHSDPLAPPEPALFDAAPNLKAEPDEPALALAAPAQAAPEPTAVEIEAWFKPLHEQTRLRLGVTAAEASFARSAPSGRRGSVRVAVIDSASGDLGGAYFFDPTGHGQAVGRLIQEVGCTGQVGCGVRVVNYPALSLSNGDGMMIQTSASGAGAYGTRARLAEQIEKAAEDWVQARRRGAGPDHLVINLSLGWSGCWDDPKAKNLDSQAVRDALTRAACRGALVVAAGGNHDSVPGCPQDPQRVGEHVFPAKWANGERLDSKVCSSVGIDGAKDEDIGPLVLGISAVDEFDQKLAIAEQESTLVAHGNAVVVPDGPSGNAWTKQLSGTSMSAAAVSGIAAAVWAAFPARTIQQLETNLIEPAVVLRPRSDKDRSFICNSLPKPLDPRECETVRRVSLCRSIAHAQGISDGCGPAAGEKTPVQFGTIPTPDVPITKGVDCSACDTATQSCEACQPAPAGTIDPAEQPWAVVGPQPEGDSCGTCNINKARRRFDATFRSSRWVGMRNGRLELSGTSTVYNLWDGNLTTQSIKIGISTAAPIRPGGSSGTAAAPAQIASTIGKTYHSTRTGYWCHE